MESWQELGEEGNEGGCSVGMKSQLCKTRMFPRSALQHCADSYHTVLYMRRLVKLLSR